MDNRYLWDRTGTADPEIQHLEQLLGQFRHTRPLRPVRRWPAAIAAAVLIGISSWLFQSPQNGWQFEKLSVQGEVQQHSLLPAGGVLETDSASHASVRVADIGTLDLEPNTHVTLISNRARDYRVFLDHGTIHALITAPPRNFFVDAPGVVAVDLGCKYTMQVDHSGRGRLEVELGWVAFESKGRESFIPAGAACSTSRENGPGIPVLLKSSPEFKAAVARYESDGTLDPVLANASRDDAFSLWHILQRVPSEQRKVVYRRMQAIAPAQVSEQAALQLDRKALDDWWDSFGLNDASFWREWKRPWSATP